MSEANHRQLDLLQLAPSVSLYRRIYSRDHQSSGTADLQVSNLVRVPGNDRRYVTALHYNPDGGARSGQGRRRQG